MRVVRLIVCAAVTIAALACALRWFVQEDAVIPTPSGERNLGGAGHISQDLPEGGAAKSTSRVGVLPLPSSASDLSRQLSGRVRYSSGRSAAARLAIAPLHLLEGVPAIEVAAAQDGTYKAVVPGEWLSVTVQAADSLGAHGEAEVVMAGEATKQVPDIVLVRPVTLRMRLAVDSRVALAVPQSIAGSLRVVLGRHPRQGLGDINDKEVALFTPGEPRQSEVVADCSEHNAVHWMFHRHGGRPSPVMTSEIPAYVAEVESTMTIDLDSLMMVTVLDERGNPAPGVPLVLWLESAERQRVEARSDASGQCVGIVPKGAHGYVQIQWDDSRIPWSSGQFASVTAFLSNRLRIKVVDWNGHPVEACSLSLRNNSLRGDDGRISGTRPNSLSPDGIQYTEWSSLEEGSVVYAMLPDVGEIAVPITKRISVGDGVFVLNLSRPQHGALRFKVEEPGSASENGIIGVHMIEGGARQGGREYRLAFRASAARAGYCAYQIIPGRYSFVASVGGKDVGQADVVVTPDELTDVIIKL